MKTRLPLSLLFASLTAVAGVAHALGSDGGGLPPEKVSGSVHYLSGGVGQSQADAIEAAQSRYPLSLEFVRSAEPRAEYLAGTHVAIRDASGNTVLDTDSDGPFLLARLPDGRYTIEASNKGERKSVQVDVNGARPVHRVFEWAQRAGSSSE